MKCTGLVKLRTVSAFSMVGCLASNTSQVAVVAGLGRATLAFLEPRGCGQGGFVRHGQYGVKCALVNIQLRELIASTGCREQGLTSLRASKRWSL